MIWNGAHREDGSHLRGQDGLPESAATPPNLPAEPQLTAPGVDMAFVEEALKRVTR